VKIKIKILLLALILFLSPSHLIRRYYILKKLSANKEAEESLSLLYTCQENKRIFL
jgi:hypothetical protein